MRRTLHLAIALLAAVLLLSSAPAEAAPRVTIVVRRVSDSVMEQFETQLRAELLTMGFEVLTLPEPPTSVDPDSLEAIAERTQAIAAIIIDQPEGNVSGRLWITERITGKTLFRKVRPEKMSSDAPTIFALRAVELLRASLLELQEPHPTRGTVPAPPQLRQLVAPQPAVPSSATPPPAAPPASAKPPPSARTQATAPASAGSHETPAPRARWSASAGVRLLGGPGGMPWSVGPALGAAWHALPGWAVQLQWSGPFSGRVEDAQASAWVDQEVMELRVRGDLLRRQTPVVPYLAAGAGLHRMGARGTASSPSRGVSNAAWSPAVSAAAGMKLRAARNLGFVFEVESIFTASRQAVVFGDRTVASGGRPLVAATVAGEVSW